MNMNASFSPDSGVLYSFTAPESGNYQFQVHSIDGTYRIASHYGEDTLFSTPRTTTSFYSYSPSITFAADSGETHFFRVRNRYAGSSYYTYDYGVRINESRQLIVDSDGNGTTMPTDTVSVYGDTLLRAIPSTPLFYLRNWRITSGSASITDTLSRTTKITLDTSDASVKAFFAKDTIHNLDFSLDTMNMTASFSPDSGVLYSFVAPKKGTYQLEVNSITNTNRRIDHYGEDSLFSTPLTSTTGYSYSPSLTFAADSGETHFLRVRNTYNNNTNYYEYDFSIRVNSQRKLVVESEGSGSTDPADTVDVFGSATLNAVPSSIRSHLKSWRIISGTADIADTSSRTTVITLDTSDVVVRATFEEDTVYTLSYYPDTMNMNASATPDSGVLYRFDAPHTDSFSLVVNSITDAYRLIDHYGNDSLFSVVQNASSGYYNSPHLTFHADSGETRYFRIRNLYSNSSYHSYDYDVRVFKRQKLRISTDGNGTTNPADSSLISGGVSSPINAVPGHNCVDFSHWSVDSGSARIADSLAAQTSITFDTTDAFITAHFVDLPHDTLVIVQSDRGLIYPRDTLFVQRDSAVSITAHPAGGYVFESWVAHEGSPVMSDAHSNHMTVTLPSGSATVGATFGIDTTIIPTLNITDIDISNHPDICITASVQDSSGRSIPGIDSSRFTVTQDNNHPLPFHMNAVSEIGGVSIALVIDRSGSMGTSQMDYAKESARSFINSMAPLDKAAILSFSTTATVDCALTSDKDSLLAAVDQISSGGNTNIGGAAYHGLEQLLAETNSKAVIVFSDGNENSTTHTTDQVVGLAKDNSIPIYSIGVGSAVDSSQVLKPIADSTGGYYRSSPDASGLADIYAQIKTDLEAQYVFCYRSDDEVFNGDQHEVILQIDHNSATVEDTAYWDESNSFPTVELTEETLDMIGVNQSQSDPITISAVITDDGSVASADLYYRRSGDSSGSYNRLSMSNSSADQYQAVITGADVEEPGIDFYIIATDNYNLAGKSPRVQNPQTEPHVIPVGNDAPLIDHLPVTSSIPDHPVSIRADITDTNGVAFAVLYYRKTTEARFTADTMLNSSGNTYTSTIPLQSVTLDNVDYYIRAVDSKGVFARNPVTGYHRITVNDNVSFTHAPDVTVSEMDSLSMVIRAHDPKGDPAIITLLSGLPPGARFDDSLADSTTLRWRPGCADQGEYDVELKAKSGQDSVSTVFTITVLDVNFKPDIHLVSDTSVWAKDTLNLVLSVNDCDSSVAALREESLPEGASFTDNLDGTGDFTWVPGIAQSGVHSAVFKITDSSSVSTEVYYDTCTITVDVPDLSAPQLTLGTRDTVVAKGTPLAISLTAAGADSTQPILIFSDLPDDADYDPDTTRHTVAQGLINWNSVSEEAFITVRACNAADTSLFDEDTVRVRVARLVVPDTVRSMEKRETVFGAEVTGGVQSADITADTLPAGAAFQSQSDTSGVFSWIPSCTDNGSYTVEFEASFENYVLRDTTLVVVSDSNCFVPELAVGVRDTLVPFGASLSIPVEASDDDGTVPRIAVENLPSGVQFDLDSASARGDLIWSEADRAGVIVIRAYDAVDENVYVEDSVRVRVARLVVPDTVRSMEKRETVFGAEVTGGVQSADITADTLPAGAAFQSQSDTSGVFSWIPSCTDNGIYPVIFEARVENSLLRDTSVLIVLDSNCFDPVLVLDEIDTVAGIGVSFRFTFSASDEDGAAPILKAKMPEDAHLSVDSLGGTGEITWTTSDTGSFSFRIRAYDRTDSTVFDEGIIRVRVMQYGARAYLSDTDGNGFVDRMALRWPDDQAVTVPEPVEQLIRACTLITHNNDTIVPVVKKAVASDSLAIEFELQEEHNAPLHTAWVKATVELADIPLTISGITSVVTEVIDGAGPVIEHARLFPDMWEKEADTLLVVLSEPVRIPENGLYPGEIFDYFRKNDQITGNSILSGRQVSDLHFFESSDTVRILLEPGADCRPETDSIRLRFYPETSLVEDVQGNTPVEENRRVPIEYGLDFIPVIVSLTDTSGDGHLDAADLFWPLHAPVIEEGIDLNGIISEASLMNHSGEEIQLEPHSASFLGDNQIRVVFDENRGTKLETGWENARIKLSAASVTENGLPFRTIQVVDSAGPVIKRAYVWTGSGDTLVTDTMVVLFSETVNWPSGRVAPEEIFKLLRDKNDFDPDAFSGLGPGDMSISEDSAVIALNNGLVVSEDSSRLMLESWEAGEDALLNDTTRLGNSPRPVNRKVPIEVIRKPLIRYIESISACPNPFIPGESSLPPLPQCPALGGNSGTRLDVKLFVFADIVEGSIDIFDAVGNPVLRGKDMVSCGKALHFVWDGRSENGRKVANGVYLVRVKIRELVSGHQEEKVFKIGVKYDYQPRYIR
ncbi:MAG: VWA domain-containing protein [Chitinispirillaceae bacterium]